MIYKVSYKEFLVSTKIVYDDEIKATCDIEWFFDEGFEPLQSFGITLGDNQIVISADSDNIYKHLSSALDVVVMASALLDYNTDSTIYDTHLLNLALVSDCALGYYDTFMKPYSDDTAFDYHGTFVIVVIESLMRHLENFNKSRK